MSPFTLSPRFLFYFPIYPICILYVYDNIDRTSYNKDLMLQVLAALDWAIAFSRGSHHKVNPGPPRTASIHLPQSNLTDLSRESAQLHPDSTPIAPETDPKQAFQSSKLEAVSMTEDINGRQGSPRIGTRPKIIGKGKKSLLQGNAPTDPTPSKNTLPNQSELGPEGIQIQGLPAEEMRSLETSKASSKGYSESPVVEIEREDAPADEVAIEKSERGGQPIRQMSKLE